VLKFPFSAKYDHEYGNTQHSGEYLMQLVPCTSHLKQIRLENLKLEWSVSNIIS
jgi:hypothetical protein